MIRTIAARLLLCAFAFVSAQQLSAAELVVIAINTGSTDSGMAIVPGSQPPVDPIGAKGYLIGFDSSTHGTNLTGVQNLTFSGANVVQRLAPNTFAAGDSDGEDVRFWSEAHMANALDPVSGSTFFANDSWWWTRIQDGITLVPVGPGAIGGKPGEPMTLTAVFNLPDATPPGIWRTAYIVATGDVTITGQLFAGGGEFDPLGREKGHPYFGQPVVLDFETNTIVPEPSTHALGLFALAAAVQFRRRGR